MSDPASITPPPEVVSLLDLPTVLAAVADPSRLKLLRLLGDGTPQSVADLAKRMGRPLDGIAKHLRVLRDARVLNAVTPPDTDGRKSYYQVPALFRTRDTTGKPLLDFGIVVVRVG